jgi:hypothetical protein
VHLQWLEWRNYSFCLNSKQLVGWFSVRRKTRTHSELTNPVTGVELSIVSVRGIEAPLRLDLIAFSAVCQEWISSARSGDLRETNKRRYNPPVLLFHYFSFANVLPAIAGALTGFIMRRGLSTCLEQPSSKRFT